MTRDGRESSYTLPRTHVTHSLHAHRPAVAPRRTAPRSTPGATHVTRNEEAFRGGGPTEPFVRSPMENPFEQRAARALPGSAHGRPTFPAQSETSWSRRHQSGVDRRPGAVSSPPATGGAGRKAKNLSPARTRAQAVREVRREPPSITSPSAANRPVPGSGVIT